MAGAKRKNASAVPPPKNICMRSAARVTAEMRSGVSEVNLETPWMVAVTITLFSGETTASTKIQTPKRAGDPSARGSANCTT